MTMALTFYIVFLLVAVVWRVLLQYQLANDHGIRVGRSSTNKVALISSTLLLGCFVASFTLTVLHVLELLQLQITVNLLMKSAGAFMCTGGIVLTAISQYQMGAAWRIGVEETEQTALITKGLYSVSRNPIYSGVIIFGIGLLILLPHVYMLISMVIGYLSIELHVRYVEEPHLNRLHGNDFTQYMKKTGRYMPRLSRIHQEV